MGRYPAPPRSDASSSAHEVDVTISESGKESGVVEIDSCSVFGSVILDLFPRTNF